MGMEVAKLFAGFKPGFGVSTPNGGGVAGAPPKKTLHPNEKLVARLAKYDLKSPDVKDYAGVGNGIGYVLDIKA